MGAPDQAREAGRIAHLRDLPPPSPGAGPGYYPDPLGGKWARWWDGTQWTQTVGPRAEPGDAPGTPLPPPAKVCRRCAAQSRTFAAECPNCGRTYGQMAVWQIIAISLASLLFLVGGCGACAFLGIRAAEDAYDDHAITAAEYESLRPGVSAGAVERRFGDPLDRDRDGGRLYLTYTDGGSLFDATFYELCFEDGRLVGKSSDERFD